MSGTASLALPSPGGSLGFLRPVLGNWYIDAVVSAHSVLPFDVQGQSVISGASCPSGSVSSLPLCQKGFAALVRPNLTGQPAWIADSHVPGGRRLNSAAFSLPSRGQGNELRNSLRGFNFSNANISLRRKIQVTERVSLQFRLDAYNALNHPKFSNPNPTEGANLSSPNFGVTTRMLYNAFGGGSVQRSGAPRSMQGSERVSLNVWPRTELPLL